MSTLSCSSGCHEAHDHSGTLQRELRRRWWLGIVFVATSCAFGYAAYSVTALFWIPSGCDFIVMYFFRRHSVRPSTRNCPNAGIT